MKNKKNTAKVVSASLLAGLGIVILSNVSPVFALTATACADADSVNLIANPSLEIQQDKIPLGWNKSSSRLNSTVFSYPVAGYNSAKAAKVEITRYAAGDAKWYFNFVPVTAGQTYNFSDEYLSNTTSSITIAYRTSKRALQYAKIAVLPPAADWQTAKITFTVPARVTSLTIYHLLDKVGWLTVDDYKLSVSSSLPNLPNVSVTSPKNGEIVAGVIKMIADTGSSPNISGVQFIVDGKDYGAEITTPPYQANLDTAVFANGLHTIAARARNAGGGKATSTAISVSVANAAPSPTPTSTNLILNSSAEESDAMNNPLNWNNSSWGENQAVFEYPVAGHNSDKALKVQMLQYASGDAKWYFDEVPVTPGGAYEFSDYYMSNVQTAVTYRFTLSDGSYIYDDITYPGSSGTWQNAKGALKAPPNAVSVTIFHLINSAGFLISDDFSLKKITPAGILPEGMISLDFDDGWLSSYRNAIPILNQFGFKSTQFIFSDAFNYPAESGYVNASQVLDMQAMGHEIGSHTRTHPDLTLPGVDLISEIAGSMQDLKNIGVSNVLSFAYPFGGTNNNVKAVVKNAGYTSARGVEFGLNDKTSDRYQLSVKSMESSISFEEAKLWIDEAVLDKNWLILVFHQVDGSGLQYSTTPDKFQQIVNYIASSGIKVVTNSEGAGILSQP